MADASYTTFCKEKVLLRSHSKFMPKVAFEFTYPYFFPKQYASNGERWLCSLDIQRALAFYLRRTKDIRRTPKIFISIAE